MDIQIKIQSNASPDEVHTAEGQYFYNEYTHSVEFSGHLICGPHDDEGLHIAEEVEAEADAERGTGGGEGNLVLGNGHIPPMSPETSAELRRALEETGHGRYAPRPGEPLALGDGGALPDDQGELRSYRSSPLHN